MIGPFILDPNQSCGISSEFERFGNDRCNRLGRELDLVALERTKRRTFWSDLVLPSFVRLGEPGGTLVRKNFKNAGKLKGFARIDLRNPPARDARRNDDAVRQIARGMFRSVRGSTGHL